MQAGFVVAWTCSSRWLVRLKRSGPGSPNLDGAATSETNSASVCGLLVHLGTRNPDRRNDEYRFAFWLH